MASIDKVTLEPVVSTTQIERVAALAREIWFEHFGPMLGRPTVEHILDQIQTPAAIERQIAEEYEYYLLHAADSSGPADPVGYLAIQPQFDEQQMLLSKLYVKRPARGRGLARRAVAFTERRTREVGLPAIVLTVYPGNASAIAAYRRMGFEDAGTIHRQIGRFEIDDVFMRKPIAGGA